MPRERIDISDKVEYLSILNENGEVDTELEPDIHPEELLKIYRTMLLARRFDERMLNLQRQGRIGTFAPISGQEASHLGAVAPLRPSDWMVPAFREAGADIWRGRSLESIIAYYNGFNEGGEIPPEMNNMPISVPVGSQVLHAVGIAWAMKYRGKDDVAVAFFGDGATSQGDFHEGLNFAAVFEAPAIFVCQNNQWAISIPRSAQTRSKTLAQKAIAYGMPGIQVDGNDILAVYSASEEAIARARAGQGPTLIECVTYRMSVHTTADDPKRYRTDEEVETWKKRDPLIRFRRYLEHKEVMMGDHFDQIEDEVQEEIQSAVDQAEARMKEMNDPMLMFDHLYAELPPYLSMQRQAFNQRIKDGQEEDHG